MISLKVAKASQYLVITGRWIKGIKLTKKAWILPGQSCTVIELSPVSYAFHVQSVSADKIPFILPAVFTVGPRPEDKESLYNYAKLMSSHDEHGHYVTRLIERAIECETRRLAACMVLEEIVKGIEYFKQEVLGRVQLELNEFGLFIYNADVKELAEVPGHDYLSDLDQKVKVQMEVANQQVEKKNEELKKKVE